MISFSMLGVHRSPAAFGGWGEGVQNCLQLSANVCGILGLPISNRQKPRPQTQPLSEPQDTLLSQLLALLASISLGSELGLGGEVLLIGPLRRLAFGVVSGDLGK